MKIEAIDLYQVKIPFQEPFRISSGEVDMANSIIIRILATDGATGYGEAAPMEGSFYSDETPDRCWLNLSNYLPALLGKEINEPTEIAAEVKVGSPFMRAAVETALWGCLAEEKNLPLYELLGGTNRKIDCGLAVGIYETIPELLAVIASHQEKGYKRTKIKIQPGWDLEPIREIRKAFGDIPLFVDANASYTINDLDTFKKLDEFNLMMFEQPFAANALEEHALLAKNVSTPVCLDEGIRTEMDAQRAIKLGSAKIVNIKLQRVGGFAPALEIYKTCKANGIDLWCGTMPELGVGQVLGMHLATLPGFVYPADLGPSLRFFKDDVVTPLLAMDSDGQLSIPEGKGLCIKVDEHKLDSFAVRKKSWHHDSLESEVV